MALRILISAGETSGDVVASHVAREIGWRRPDCRLYGLGGRHMEHAGVDLVAAASHLGAVGITEGIAVAPAFWRCWRSLRSRIAREPPAVALLVGNDVFHLWVARRLKAMGIPAIALFPPQVWIWQPLAGSIARSYDLICACFPDEQRVYEAAGGAVVFVGHYLVDSLEPVTPDARNRARASLFLSPGRSVGNVGDVVALLPGSRRREIERIAPVMLDSVVQLLEHRPHLRCVLPVAEGRFRRLIENEIDVRRLADRIVISEDSRTAMQAADILLVASGTATLEGMLLRLPMVIAYRMSTPSYAFLHACARLGLISATSMGIPNLVLGRRAVPELLQNQLTPAALAAEAESLLSSGEQRRAQQVAFAEAASRLAGGGSLRRVAEAVVAAGERRQSESPRG